MGLSHFTCAKSINLLITNYCTLKITNLFVVEGILKFRVVMILGEVITCYYKLKYGCMKGVLTEVMKSLKFAVIRCETCDMLFKIEFIGYN